MTGQIMYAMQQEVLAFLKANGGIGSVINRKAFSPDNWPTYGMPLVTLMNEPGEDFQEMIGGRTMCDWEMTLSAYNVAPDVSGYDPTPYSAERENWIDEVRRHFKTYKVWLSQEMIDAVEKYGLTFSLSGATDGEPLEKGDGQVQGTAFRFACIAWDTTTDGSIEKKPLVTVNQLNPPPAY